MDMFGFVFELDSSTENQEDFKRELNGMLEEMQTFVEQVLEFEKIHGKESILVVDVEKFKDHPTSTSKMLMEQIAAYLRLSTLAIEDRMKCAHYRSKIPPMMELYFRLQMESPAGSDDVSNDSGNELRSTVWEQQEDIRSLCKQLDLALSPLMCPKGDIGGASVDDMGGARKCAFSEALLSSFPCK
eukprot:m.44155 g.44155  ORF g.44155 m.44155 type:complete len:186 (+) comp7152_c0_seq1:2090-2647(+)